MPLAFFLFILLTPQLPAIVMTTSVTHGHLHLTLPRGPLTLLDLLHAITVALLDIATQAMLAFILPQSTETTVSPLKSTGLPTTTCSHTAELFILFPLPLT